MTLELVLFYSFAGLAVFGALAMLLFVRNIVASAMSLVVTMVSLAGIYVLLEAHLVAVLQIMVYAGAILVLFLFVIMMLNLGQHSRSQEKSWLSPRIWIAPSVMVAILLAQLINALSQYDYELTPSQVGVMELSALLFGPYVLAVELASILLLAGLVSAYHLAKK